MIDKGKQLEKLIHMAEKNGIKILFTPFKSNDGLILKHNGEYRIGLRMDMGIDDYIKILAHELAHFYLHIREGIDVIDSENEELYEMQADQVAEMVTCLLNE